MGSIGRATKDALATEIRNRLTASRHLIVTRFNRLTPAASGRLRRQLRGADASCLVTKRRLLVRALADSQFQGAAAWADGPTAVIVTQRDPARVSKAVLAFITEHEQTLEIRGGIIEGESLSPADIVTLAKLPSREQLLTHVATSCQAPLQGLAGVLHGVLRQCVTVIAHIQQRKEETTSHG